MHMFKEQFRRHIPIFLSHRRLQFQGWLAVSTRVEALISLGRMTFESLCAVVHMDDIGVTVISPSLV
jgi:hypothetical protein